MVTRPGSTGGSNDSPSNTLKRCHSEGSLPDSNSGGDLPKRSPSLPKCGSEGDIVATISSRNESAKCLRPASAESMRRESSSLERRITRSSKSTVASSSPGSLPKKSDLSTVSMESIEKQEREVLFRRPGLQRKLTRTESLRTQASIKLLDEKISMIGYLKSHFEHCRRLESTLEDLGEQVRGIAKTRLELVTSHHQQQEGTNEERQDFCENNNTSSKRR